MADWEIKINTDDPETFESLGCGQIRGQFGNQIVDKVTFRQGGADFDGTPLLAFADEVVIYKDSVAWFAGVALNPELVGEPGDESILYTIAGPWYYMERKTYTQTWKTWDSDTSTEVNTEVSRYILGSDLSGNRVNSGDVIEDAATQASLSEARYQIGSIAPDTILPWEWYRDATCAEIIMKMMRWNPDCVAWFDYTTEPPTFKVTSRSAASADSYTIGTAPLKGVPRLVPLQDMQATGVIINYEAEDEIDGVRRMAYGQDLYPPTSDPDDLRTLVMTIELAGLIKSFQRERIVTEALPTDFTTDKAWWKEQLPALADIADADLTIGAATRTDNGPAGDGPTSPPGTPPPRYLISGRVHDWVEGVWRLETISAPITYDVRATPGDTGTDITHKGIRETISVDVITTDEPTKTHKRPQTDQLPESPPADLAEKFYNAVSQLQYQGTVVLAEEEVGTTNWMGRVLNLAGGATAWATMRAVIQTYSVDVDTGITTLTIGPHKHLTPADIVEWLRLSRNRDTGTALRSTSEAVTGDVTGSGPSATRGRSGSVNRELPDLPTTTGDYLLFYSTATGAPEWKLINDDLEKDLLLDDIDTSTGLSAIEIGVSRLKLPDWLASWTDQADNDSIEVTDCS